MFVSRVAVKLVSPERSAQPQRPAASGSGGSSCAQLDMHCESVETPDAHDNGVTEDGDYVITASRHQVGPLSLTSGRKTACCRFLSITRFLFTTGAILFSCAYAMVLFRAKAIVKFPLHVPQNILCSLLISRAKSRIVGN